MLIEIKVYFGNLQIENIQNIHHIIQVNCYEYVCTYN